MIGKCLGGIFGYLLGHSLGFSFLGLITGVWIGSKFDKGWYRLLHHNPHQTRFSFQFNPGSFGNFNHRAQTQKLFFKTTFQVMGHIAKSDGRISKEEIKSARQAMTRMRLNADQKQEAIRYFQEGKQPNFNLEAALSSLASCYRGQSLLLYLFVEIQIQAAYEKGRLSSTKRHYLTQICQKLGLGAGTFDNINSRFGAEQHYTYGHSYYQQNHGQAHYQNNTTSLEDAYKVLGVPPSASKDTIKKAYRRKMNQHHPDKLIAKGLPESMIKIATEKTQAIKAAYEQIKKSRGL